MITRFCCDLLVDNNLAKLCTTNQNCEFPRWQILTIKVLKASQYDMHLSFHHTRHKTEPPPTRASRRLFVQHLTWKFARSTISRLRWSADFMEHGLISGINIDLAANPFHQQHEDTKHTTRCILASIMCIVFGFSYTLGKWPTSKIWHMDRTMD